MPSPLSKVESNVFHALEQNENRGVLSFGRKKKASNRVKRRAIYRETRQEKENDYFPLCDRLSHTLFYAQAKSIPLTSVRDPSSLSTISLGRVAGKPSCLPSRLHRARTHSSSRDSGSTLPSDLQTPTRKTPDARREPVTNQSGRSCHRVHTNTRTHTRAREITTCIVPSLL